MKTIEAWYGAPPDREGHVVQLFLAGEGRQWGEVSVSGGRLMLDVFPSESSSDLSLPVDELLEVMRLAQQHLCVDT